MSQQAYGTELSKETSRTFTEREMKQLQIDLLNCTTNFDWEMIKDSGDLIDQYIKTRLARYRLKGYQGEELHEVFHDDFFRMGEGGFARAHLDNIRDLRDLLKKNKVRIAKRAGLKISRALTEAVQAYSEEEYNTLEAGASETETQESESQKGKEVKREQHIQEYSPPPMLLKPRQHEYTSGQDTLIDPVMRIILSEEEPITTEYGEYQRQINFIDRIYANKHKYTGINQSLSQHTKTFLFHCRRAGLPKHIYHIAFPAILDGNALDYYHKLKKEDTESMVTLYQKFKTHYEGPIF
jgi:hypothetical protein